MNTTMKKLGFVCATAVALAFVSPGAVRATEPIDDTAPWGTPSMGYVVNTQNVTTYISNNNGVAGWGTGADRQIYPTTDVDYAVMQCGNYSGLVTSGKISDVGISYNPGAGDLDIAVYDPSGVYLGGSFGTSGTETVSLSSFGLDSVVIKVYAYSGTGGYSIGVNCY